MPIKDLKPGEGLVRDPRPCITIKLIAIDPEQMDGLTVVADVSLNLHESDASHPPSAGGA